MEKQSLNRLRIEVQPGLVESVKWESKEGSLTTSFISDDKSVLGSVTMKEFDNSDHLLVYMIQPNLQKCYQFLVMMLIFQSTILMVKQFL